MVLNQVQVLQLHVAAGGVAAPPSTSTQNLFFDERQFRIRGKFKYHIKMVMKGIVLE